MWDKGVTHAPGETESTARGFHHASQRRTIHNSRTVHFWNFPCNIFRLRLTLGILATKSDHKIRGQGMTVSLNLLILIIFEILHEKLLVFRDTQRSI